MVSDLRAADELDVSDLRGHSDDLFGVLAVAVHQVEVSLWQAAFVHQSQELLEDDRDSAVDLDQQLVAGHQTTEAVESVDLDGEVEWGDVHAGTEWESVSDGLLSGMITWNNKTLEENSWGISCPVFKEPSGDNQFASGLDITLRNDSMR